MAKELHAMLGVSVALLLAGCVQYGTEKTAMLPPETRVIEAVRASVPPTVDGRIDDPCWRQAQPVTGFLCMNSDLLATYQSTGYVCYDDENLYIAVKCLMPEGGTPQGYPKPRDSYVFSDDIVEIMVDAGRTQSEYYQLVVSAYGAVYDSARKGGGAQNDPSWNGDWVGKAFIGDKFWSAELAIPFHCLGVSPEMGKLWGLNICREAKRPRDEWSTIAARGTFNSASDFAVVRGIDVDFRPYHFQIGPAVTTLEPAEDRPYGLLTIPVTNRTGVAKRVKIERVCVVDGKEQVESRAATLAAGATESVAEERLPVEALLPERTDGYVIRGVPSTVKVSVADADSGRLLAVAQPKRPFLFEPLKMSVDDPWRRDMTAGQTEAVELNVFTALRPEHLKKGQLTVSLASKETGAAVAEKRISAPSDTERVRFDTTGIPWGAYELRASFRDGAGREMLATRAVATVLPGGKQQIKILNNQVSELMNAAERGLAGEKEFSFMNPRSGWVFVSIAGEGSVALDGEAAPIASSKTGAQPTEAMRFLSVGRHTLHAQGNLDQVIVRAIPELMYSCHPSGFTWDFLKKHVLSDCNVILGGTDDAAAMAEWKAAGKSWRTFMVTPGHTPTQDVFHNAQQCYDYIVANDGYRNPLTRGVQVDMIGGATLDQKKEYAAALSRIASDPALRDRAFVPWYEGMVFGSEGDKAFMKVVLEAGWPFSYYVYLVEQTSEAQVKADIQASIVRIGLSADKQIPGSLRNAIVTLGYWSDVLSGQVQDIDAGANFKALMQMQADALANDPALFGVFGVLWYYSPYVDEETLRWSARLYRHYGIEGKTAPLADYPYRLTHIVNPEFKQGTEGWIVTEAEPGSVTVKSHPGYGHLEGRYTGGTRGDTFLVTRRSAAGPNSFSQEIKDLKPGCAYSLKMITANYRSLIEEKSVKAEDAISISLENTELVALPDKNRQTTYPNHYAHPLGKFTGDCHFFLNYHWYVFRARGTTAKLTISDWKGPAGPGGPAGEEIMYNFIEVEPYLE